MTNVQKTFAKFIENRANETLRKKAWSEDYALVIFSAWSGKIVAAGLSAYFAYRAVLTWWLGLLPETWSIGLTVFSLLVIEAAVAGFILKLWVSIFEKQFGRAGVNLLFFVLVFYLSAQTSLHGVQKHHQAKTYTANNIDSLQQVYVNTLQTSFSEDSAFVAEQIMTIRKNPTVWTGSGRRDGLSPAQLHKIDSLNNVLFVLTQKHRGNVAKAPDHYQSLAQNNLITAQNEAQSSTVVIWIVLILQIITTGYIVFSYVRTRFEQNLPEVIKSEIKNQVDKMVTGVVDFARDTISDINSGYLNAIRSNRTIVAEMFTQDYTPVETDITESKTEKKIKGFDIADVNKPETTVNNNIQSVDKNIQGVNKNIQSVHTSKSSVNKNTRDHRITGSAYNANAVDKVDTSEFILYKDSVWGIGICPNCGKVFARKSYNHKFCSNNDKCRNEYNDFIPQKKK